SARPRAATTWIAWLTRNPMRSLERSALTSCAVMWVFPQALDGHRVSANRCVHTHVSLGPGTLDDRPPELLFSLDEADEVGGEHRPEGRSHLFDASLQVWVLQRLEEVLPQLVNNRLRRPLGGNERLPADRRKAWNRLRRSRQVRKLFVSFAGHDRKR